MITNELEYSEALAFMFETQESQPFLSFFHKFTMLDRDTGAEIADVLVGYKDDGTYSYKCTHVYGLRNQKSTYARNLKKFYERKRKRNSGIWYYTS